MTETRADAALHPGVVPAGSREPSTMTLAQAKVLGIATLGGIFEFYEFVIFIYLAPIIGQHFFPADMPAWLRQVQTLGIFAAGYLIRPVGGVILANVGDFIGRKRMFAFTLILLAVPTIAIGCLPGYAQIGIGAPLLLLLCRMVQGLSIGGELPGALCFVSEHVPERRLGLCCGILSASLGVGAVLGSGSVAGLTAWLGKAAMSDYGWRIPFIVGGILGLASAQLRRYAHETPVFLQMRARNELSRQVPMRGLMERHRPELVLCVIISCMTAVVTAGVHLFPAGYFITSRQFEPALVYRAQFYAALALIAGDVAAGWLCDRFGLRGTFTVGAFSLIAGLLWMYGDFSPEALPLRYAIVGFISGTVSLSFVLLIRSFPAQLRYTGIAVTYNLAAAVIGGTTPLFLAMLVQANSGWAAWYPSLFCIVAVISAFLLHRYRKPINPYAV
ncbi:MFS transporter [Cupriavidus basilensis]|uniref:MFS transporter n=1 Tax=Cupriavidus basilensis TaxID=68895 RepID=UPI0020A6625E|nr:MFS transporter [Cupriavidus basilensis]MCP3024094.1 MFS transporter [Cupriavidus basilensis]